MNGPINIFWLRRDLRFYDNTALIKASAQPYPVLFLFIFDNAITDELSIQDARISFIYKRLKELHLHLQQRGGGLLVKKGNVLSVWESLLKEYSIHNVFVNTDFEPYGIQRDRNVKELLEKEGISFKSFPDHLIFVPGEVVKADGLPYTIFTPFKNKWLERYRQEKYSIQLKDPEFQVTDTESLFPELADLGFDYSPIKPKPLELVNIKEYDLKRDYPALEATTHSGIYLRFGTVSIRELVMKAEENPVFLNELIWREFFIHILYFFPHIVTSSFKPRYDRIRWNNNPDLFNLWCQGKTGYPLVDAGMRQLNQTGTMHNRVRMVTASFLCKHLLIDWRWGEAYFAQKLLDFELASNNGNWQWAAGTGCDAAPYFRIFNPAAQAKKFDPKDHYIIKWVPELNNKDYPKPIVNHQSATQLTLKRYREALNDK